MQQCAAHTCKRPVLPCTALLYRAAMSDMSADKDEKAYDEKVGSCRG